MTKMSSFLVVVCLAQPLAAGHPLLAVERDFEGEWREAEKSALRGPDRGYAEMVIRVQAFRVPVEFLFVELPRAAQESQ